MRLRLLFFAILIISTYFGATYFIDFLQQNPGITSKVTLSFVIFVVISIALQMTGNIARAAKSQFLLNDIRDSKISTLFKGLSVGYLFNSLLPLRLGEFIRAFYVGDALSISKTTVFMSIVIERVVDGFILSVCFFAAGFFIRNTSTDAYQVMTRFGIGLFIVSLLLMLIIKVLSDENKYLLKTVHAVTGIFNDNISNRLRLMAWSGIYGTKLMLQNKPALRRYYLASVGMWVIYFASTACIVFAFFGTLSASKIWYVIQSTYASVSTPVGPGYIGSFYSLASRLLSYIGLDSVGGFVVFMWLIIVLPVSLVGLFVLAKQRLGEKKDIPKQEVLINKLYREKDISTEFGNFLDAYFTGERINHLLTQAELNDRFRLIKSFKGGSNAHTMLVWQNDEMRVKKITLLQYADKLEDQAKWLLEKDNLPHLPKVVDQEKNDQYYSFDLAYKEDYFPFFDYIHKRSSKQSSAVLDKVLTFMNKHIYQNTPVKENRDNLDNYIKNKILAKVTDTANVNSEISHLMIHKKININGNTHTNLVHIIEKIKKHKQAMKELSLYNETQIHGDLTIDNLIVSDKGDFMVIDPNNENQVSSPVVDFGKLYQSLHSGYEFLIQLEQCQINGNTVNYEDAKSQKYEEIFKNLDAKLKESLKPEDYRAILFHEAVHYCRMLTYRANINPQTVAVFYGTAVKLFNEFLEQYE